MLPAVGSYNTPSCASLWASGPAVSFAFTGWNALLTILFLNDSLLFSSVLSVKSSQITLSIVGLSLLVFLSHSSLLIVLMALITTSILTYLWIYCILSSLYDENVQGTKALFSSKLCLQLLS